MEQSFRKYYIGPTVSYRDNSENFVSFTLDQLSENTLNASLDPFPKLM